MSLTKITAVHARQVIDVERRDVSTRPVLDQDACDIRTARNAEVGERDFDLGPGVCDRRRNVDAG